MNLTIKDKQTPRWATYIKLHRKRMKLSQVGYGMLFGVSGPTVSNWENGVTEAPYAVTWSIFKAGLLR